MNLAERKSLKYNLTHQIINGIEYKLCTKCNNWFPCNLEYFYKWKYAQDGLHPNCKKCHKKYQNKRYEDKPEIAKWYADDYYYNNKDKRLSDMKLYVANNTEQVRLKQLEWQRKFPEKCKEYNQNRQHKNHDITEKQWLECKRYFNNICAYCGIPIEKHLVKFKGRLILSDFHKEHVIYNGANDLSNCVPSCKSCNSSKWEYNFEEWYSEGNPRFLQDRLDKINKWRNEDYKEYL